ncbi:hypothetical protein ABPG74_001980, partial [Tetrahymena malaccensis]
STEFNGQKFQYLCNALAKCHSITNLNLNLYWNSINSQDMSNLSTVLETCINLQNLNINL